ncbi:phosphoglycerate mutase family protein [Mangrovivirga sp. M17]|uniref:Phosphoglycerate mutase family protein n=1 Tax=Mangrovivirga halotolerans TaxID=2993936 RepID=A0ABT3RWL5_9BACT|nr:phosphoglycerate mutase family protein [Mangrovivirga halotolerans]MCX2746056.1 phosphoglycerate mutase family protein [Mangrovivirga halotolerans]
MKLKSYFFLIVAFLVFISCTQEKSDSEQLLDKPEIEPTIIFLTRHAEKDTLSNDPDLSATGFKRVETLTSMLKNVEFDGIYSTNYKRTIQTVKPIADQNSLVIMPYEPSESTKEFAKKIKENEKGNTILVSGHSNTIPFLINEFIGEEMLQQFEDNQYGDLFMVMLSGEKAEVLRFYVPLITGSKETTKVNLN